MSGWPGRVLRAAFGPLFVNVGKVTNPAANASADLANLLAWQVAGMNGTVPRGMQLCTISGSVLTKGRKWLAWDPNGQLAASAVDVVRSGTGIYTWGLSSSSFPDMNGVTTQLALDWVRVIPMGTTNLLGIGDVNANGYQGTANVFTANTGAAADPAKLLLLFG